MKMSHLMLFAIAVILVSVVPTKAENWQIYSTVGTGGGANLPNTLITVNHQTGEQIQRGSQGATPAQYALDADPISGYLFGINPWNKPGVVTRIDPCTGEWAEVATIQQDTTPITIYALAFSPTGTLYGISGGKILGTINLVTNTFSSIATLDVPSHVQGMDFSQQGVLYLVDHDNVSQQCVRVVDVLTGKITSTTILTGNYMVGDIDFAPDGYIYQTNFSWALIKIDPSTGTQTFVGFGSLGPLGGIASVQAVPEPAIEVIIDIKPGSCPNPLNVKSSGVLPVAILGLEDFDVTTIDATSVQLAGVGAIRHSFEDVATPVDDTNDCNCTEAGPDGLVDLTLKFKTQRIVEAVGEVNDGSVLELLLSGVLSDETPIEGADCILIRGRHKPINQADINKDGVVNATDFSIFAQNWLQSSIVDE